MLRQLFNTKDFLLDIEYSQYAPGIHILLTIIVENYTFFYIILTTCFIDHSNNLFKPILLKVVVVGGIYIFCGLGFI